MVIRFHELSVTMSGRRSGSFFSLYTALIVAGALSTVSAKYGIVRFAPSDSYEHPERGPVQARECDVTPLILDYSANGDAEILVDGVLVARKSADNLQKQPHRKSDDGEDENRKRLGLDTGVFLMPKFAQNDDGDDDDSDHESSGEHHHDGHHDDHHEHDDDRDKGSKGDHGPYFTSTTTTAPPEIPTPCTSLVISANTTTSWASGITTQTQFAITIEKWSNGCFYVENLDVPGRDRITRACYDNGRFIPEMSVGRIGDDSGNPVAARGGIGFVIVVYPGYDTKNFRFWWTVDYPDVSIVGPLSANPPAERKSKDSNRPHQIKYEGRVVVTPYIVSAGYVSGEGSFDCGRFIGTNFARCPGTGCLHLTFFCDGHFNCANTEVGDYDESWYICGYMLRAVILPTLSLLTLVLAALAAFYLLRRRRRMFAESSSPRAFRSGTESRRCSVHPLPLDASNLSSASAMNKAREAAASGGASQNQRQRSSSGRSVSVECDVPDLVTPPGYEHPPDYQSAIFQVPPQNRQQTNETEGGGKQGAPASGNNNPSV